TGVPSAYSQFVLFDLNVVGDASATADARFNQVLSVTAQLTPTPAVLPSGTLVSNAAAEVLEGVTKPGAQVDLETDGDGLFDEGHTTADAAGHYAFAVTLTDGVNAFQVRATSRYDQRATAQAQVTLDRLPPTIAVTSPAPGFVTNHNPTVAGQVTDTF